MSSEQPAGVDEDFIVPQQRVAVHSTPMSNEFLALDEQQTGSSSYHHHQVNDSPPVTRVDRRRVLPNFPESNYGHTNDHVMDETHGVIVVTTLNINALYYVISLIRKAS